MTTYVALLRGIGPGNPNMRNEKLRWLFEKLGFENIESVISSGNIIFDSGSKDMPAMEAKIEAAFPKLLGYNCTTIIRSTSQIQALVESDPFKGMTHGPRSYLLATFFKNPAEVTFKLPYQPEGKTYKLLSVASNTLFTATDNTLVKTTDLMTWLEKKFGKQISSRTWLTLNRILKKMENR